MNEHTPLQPTPLSEDGDNQVIQPTEQNVEVEQTPTEISQETATLPEQTASRWYAVENDAPNRTCKPKKERALLVWAAVATVAFLLCFSLLLGVAVLYFTGSLLADNGLSAEIIAENASPATVLISCKNDTSYSYGTGFFLREDGYIATNYHVIEDAAEIRVTLFSGQTLVATKVGHHAAADLAVLHISGRGYPVLPIGNSDALRVGERAVVIGNPAGPDAPWTVTQGIFSYLDRTIPVSDTNWTANLIMLQTDAAVNHGNSGGPICNARGEVVGIVTRKLTDNEAIGFAIPINGAMEILNAILDGKKAGEVHSSIVTVRPLMGITVIAARKGETYPINGIPTLAPETGLMIQSVDPLGVAYRKLYSKDVIVAINGVPVADPDTLADLMEKKHPGDWICLSVIRNGLQIEVNLQLAPID
ncbi:MAG: serine protease [Clostridia bacterium]|nr:serine protease [Clostridia bacterium]